MFSWIIQNIKSLNSSRFFAGIIMLLLNIGSKYIKITLTDTQKKILEHSYARQILVFAISWMGTRDIFKALVLTGIFHLLSAHLLHEESPYCVIPAQFRKFEKLIDTDNSGVISPEEVDRAIKILEKARKEGNKRNHLRMVGSFGTSH